MIPVFLAVDENFAPFAATTICSIMKNTKSFVKFFIIADDVSILNKMKICKLKNEFCDIEFIDVDGTVFDDLPTMEFVSRTAYCRYLIPQLKPELGKVIYTDVDVIFEDDVAKLYEDNLENYPIGAVYNFVDGQDVQEHYNNLEIPSEHKFFWSGLLLIDCEKCRQLDTVKHLLDTTREYSKALVWPDLDVYNKVFANNYKELSPKYCVIPQYANQMKRISSEYFDAVKNPFIIHFAGEKPWQNKDILFADKFWQYVKNSGFRSEIDEIYRKSWRNKSIKIFRIKVFDIFRTKNFYRIKFGFLTLFKTASLKNFKLGLLFGFFPVFIWNNS